MKFRATWAGVLTAIMLCVSSAASSCEAKCNLGGLRPACHSDAAKAAQAADMDSGMCHGSARSRSDAAPAYSVSRLSSCSHHVCAEQPATLTDQRSPVTHLLLLAAAGSVSAQKIEPEPLARSFAGRGPPPYHPPSLVDLHIIQRV